MGSQEILTGGILTVDEVIGIIDAVTAAELKRLATALLVGDRLRLAAVGNIDPDSHWEDLLQL